MGPHGKRELLLNSVGLKFVLMHAESKESQLTAVQCHLVFYMENPNPGQHLRKMAASFPGGAQQP